MNKTESRKPDLNLHAVLNRARSKIVIPGGSGQVGSVLTRAFRAAGHEVVVLSRRSGDGMVHWDGRTLGPWTEAIDGADVVINLAGQSVDCRYHNRNRRRIMDSRIESTRVIGEAIRRAARPPRVWLQAATATIYAHRYDAPNDEATGIIGGDEEDAPDTWRFSIDVARAWEKSLDQADTPHTRKVKLRMGMVMSPDRGGVFDTLLGLVRRGLGGRTGDGRQYMSWIHHEDFARALLWLIDRDDIAGPVNVCSPNPVTNAAFMAALRDAWGIKFGLPATRWMLEIATLLMRTESELVLKSRRVIPGRLTQSGFSFRHPTWPEAARALCAEWRTRRRGSANRGAASVFFEK